MPDPTRADGDVGSWPTRSPCLHLNQGVYRTYSTQGKPTFASMLPLTEKQALEDEGGAGTIVLLLGRDLSQPSLTWHWPLLEPFDEKNHNKNLFSKWIAERPVLALLQRCSGQGGSEHPNEPPYAAEISHQVEGGMYKVFEWSGFCRLAHQTCMKVVTTNSLDCRLAATRHNYTERLTTCANTDRRLALGVKKLACITFATCLAHARSQLSKKKTQRAPPRPQSCPQNSAMKP